MTRNLFSLCAVLAAALALGLTTAGTAGADVFTTEAVNVMVTGAQEGTDVFKLHGGEVKCTTVKYTASVSSGSSSQVTASPTYSGCTFAGLAATIGMNGCDYLLKINAEAGNTTLTEDVVCPSGKEITITAPSVGTAKCITHIPPQTGLGPASAVNVGSLATREVTITAGVTNMKYSQTAGTAETGNCATADNTTGGTYTGKALLTGENFSGTAHIGIFLS